MAPVSNERVGVVFVHGIGSQPESETLRHFADPVIKWIQAWYRARGLSATPKAKANLSYGNALDPHEPANAEITLPAIGGAPERALVFAEAWWSQRIDPPSVGQMLAWVLSAMGAAFKAAASGIAYRVGAILGLLTSSGRKRWKQASDPGPIGLVIELLNLVVQFAYLVVALILAVPVVLIVLAIAQIPIKQVQEFFLVRLITPFFTQALGDFSTYIGDDLQALHVRHRVSEAVHWLVTDGKCESVCVVAHSQGTVVAFDALTGDDLPDIARVKKFITVGGALNKAFLLTSPRLGRLWGQLPKHIFWVDVWSFFDPVPGGIISRPSEKDGVTVPTLVAPDAALATKMHWWGPATTPGPTPLPVRPMKRTVTNFLNYLTEHDTYWRNAEQFVSRLAQELDDPDGYYEESRFFPEGATPDERRQRQNELVRRRRARVAALAGWRLVGFASFAAALVGRGPQTLFDDGRTIGDVLQRLGGNPVAQVIGLPFQLAGTIKDLLAILSPALKDVPLGVPTLAWLAGITDPKGWQATEMIALSAVALGVLFYVVYRLLTAFVFDGWERGETAATVQPSLSPPLPWSSVALRTIVVCAPLIALARALAAG